MRICVFLGAAFACATSAAAGNLIDIQGHPVLIGEQTQVFVDDERLPPGAPLPDKRGLRVEARLADARAAGPLGVAPAATVIFSYAVRGPVTSTAPLRVLGQEVTVTSDTGLTGFFGGGSVASLVPGDHLDVSGYVDTNASLLASFIEYLPVPTPRWLLSGYVSAVDGSDVLLGPQRVSLAGVTPIDCGDALAPGQFVEIRADAIGNFGPDSVLDTVTRLTCVQPVPLGTPGALGALTGIVGEMLSPTSFRFGPHVVTFDADTGFRFGNADDLVPGAAIEVDGVFGDGLAFAAQDIQFAAPMIRLEGPVEPGDVMPGPDGTVRVLGNSVRRAAQLRDRDAVFSAGIGAARQVELRGYLDHLGQRWATRARLRGAPDPADVRAGGPVEAVARPLLSVLGVGLDSEGAIFEDPAARPLDADAFFALALPGAIVEQSGILDGTSMTIHGGVLALVTPLDAPAPPPAGRNVIVGTLRGTDALFADGFD